MVSSGRMMALENYSVNYNAFQFEREFEGPAIDRYMEMHRTDSFLYSGVYIMVVFGGKAYMNNRPGFDLRPAMALWSGLLAIVSIFGAARTLPEMMYALNHRGFEYSVCVNSYVYHTVTRFWAVIFVLSKPFELVDTLFIVLRKQRLIFLHWYHHATVLMYTWYSYIDYPAPARWFVVMNYVVHAFMYSYYTLRALRFRVPKFINISITLLQVLQMLIGIYVTAYALHVKNSGAVCHQSKENAWAGLLMYTSYLVLFGHFFYTSYLKKEEVAVKKHS